MISGNVYRKCKEFKNKKAETKCPDDYKQCIYYHPEREFDIRCIKSSIIKFCIEELREWLGMNRQILNTEV